MSKHHSTSRVQKNDSETFFTCKQAGCNFKTKSQSSCKRHSRIHNSSSSSSSNSKTRKPFKCSNSSCGYRTRYSWNLKEHERIHDPDHLKSSQCSACFKYFSRSRDVARHQTTCRAFLERKDNNVEGESTDEGQLSEDEGQLGQDEDPRSRDEDPLSRDEDPLSQDANSPSQDEGLLSQNEDHVNQDKVKKDNVQIPQDQLSQNEDHFSYKKVKKDNVQIPQDHQLSQNEDKLNQDKVKKENLQSHKDQQGLIKSKQVKLHNNSHEYHPKNDYSRFEEHAEINMSLQVLMKVKRFKCPKCGHRSENIQDAKTHLDSHSSNSDLLICPVAECTSAGYVREDDLVKHLFEIHGIKKKVPPPRSDQPNGSQSQVTEVPSTGRATRAKKLQS